MSLYKPINKLKTSIIDGYLDEPSCLGVPPYISPHIRYVYGALVMGGIHPDNIDYYLIDQIRDEKEKITDQLSEVDMLIIIAGATVPGRYLRGRPISLREISELTEKCQNPYSILGGPIIQRLSNNQLEQWKLHETIDLFCQEIAAITLYNILHERDPHENIPEDVITEFIDKWALYGAHLTTKHRDYPNIVCEIETFRGCVRAINCAFCSERLKIITYNRKPGNVVEEVKTLYELGNRYFRLGCQTDLLAYGADRKSTSIVLNPNAIDVLYSGIRAVAPDIKVLHMDNANPASIAQNPTEATRILEIITENNTPGDVAAFGMESADPEVLKANNINALVQDTLKAIEMMNKMGGIRQDGIPKLLPGLNFLHGLQGESKSTMDLNFAFLKDILDRGLMLRRINIRQVLEVGGYKAQPVNSYKFNKYKEKVNEEINLSMIKRVFPTDTILKDVLLEKQEGNLTFGRQLGTYPILVGIPGSHSIGKFINTVIIDHGYRSVTALPYPFNINNATIVELRALPGIGKKRAQRIFMARPIKSMEHLQEILDKTYDISPLKNWVEF